MQHVNLICQFAFLLGFGLQSQEPPADRLQRDQPTVAEIRPHRTVRHIPLQPHQLTEHITPNKDVFILCHVGVPRARAEDWWLDVAGLVDKPVRMSFAELCAMPKRTVTALHECAGFPLRPDIATRLYANVVCGGVDLGALLRSVGVKPEATFLWSFGVDQGVFETCRSTVYLKDMPLSRLERGDVLLAYEMNREPLDAEHGFPLRLIIPGYYGTNLVKWLYRIQLADRRPEAPYTTRYYNDPVPPSPDNPAGGLKPLWELPPESVIVSPAQLDVLDVATIEIWGWAWAGGGLSHVDISVDDGNTWANAQTESAEGSGWKRFTFSWKPSTRGNICIMSRAHDIRGATQPTAKARNSIYRVEVHVK